MGNSTSYGTEFFIVQRFPSLLPVSVLFPLQFAFAWGALKHIAFKTPVHGSLLEGSRHRRKKLFTRNVLVHIPCDWRAHKAFPLCFITRERWLAFLLFPPPSVFSSLCCYIFVDLFYIFRLTFISRAPCFPFQRENHGERNKFSARWFLGKQKVLTRFAHPTETQFYAFFSEKLNSVLWIKVFFFLSLNCENSSCSFA